MYASLLALLTSLPVFTGDTETPLQRSARLETIAHAVDSAGDYATCTGDYATVDWCRPVWPRKSARQLKVMLIMLGRAESNFAERVHAGRCRADECDAVKLPGGRVFHRAQTPWQMQYTALVAPEWASMVGKEYWPTFQAAYAASKVLGASWSRCRREPQRGPLTGDWMTWSVSGYATGGRTCSWSRAAGRVAEYQRLYAASLRPLPLPPAHDTSSTPGLRVAAEP